MSETDSDLQFTTISEEEFAKLPEMDSNSARDLAERDGLFYDGNNEIVGKSPRYDFKFKPQPIQWDQFDNAVFPKDQWIIKNLVPYEGFVIIASPSGEKKSWIALDMARSIVNGENFLGNENLKAIPRNVMYIDIEMPKRELQRRCRLLGYKKSEKQIWLLSMNDLNFNHKLYVNWLLKFIEEKEIGVIFFDTVRAVGGGMKEEKAEEIRMFFNRFKSLKDKGSVIVFLDHCRKPNRLESKIPKKEQLFGSQDKVASAEILLMLKSEAGNDEVAIYQNKNRLDKEIKPFKISIKDQVNETGEVIGVNLSYGGEFEEQELKKDEAKEMILSVLTDGGKTTKELVELGKELGIGERNIKQAARELEKDIMVEVHKKGRENFYTFLKISTNTDQNNNVIQQSTEDFIKAI